MAELAGIRRHHLERLVSMRGFLGVADASDELSVSEVTIRADLSALQRDGRVTRVHGGAIPAGVAERTLESSLDTDTAAKSAIADSAAAMVSSGDAIYLDAGSTATAVAHALVDRAELRDIVVVTSGLTIALALERAVPRFTVLVTGGTLRPLQHSLVSPFALPMLDKLNVDIAFIGCNGIHADRGVTNINLAEAEIKSRILARSARNVLVADATKLGRIDVARIAAITDFEALVTAGNATQEALADLRRGGLTIVVADRLTA